MKCFYFEFDEQTLFTFRNDEMVPILACQDRVLRVLQVSYKTTVLLK